MITIEKSVGKGGHNLPIDVIKIQNLINNNDLYTGLTSPLPVCGLASFQLDSAIEAFQTNHPDLKTVDGKVDPKGSTLKKLNDFNNKQQVCRDYYPAGFSKLTFQMFSVPDFLDLYGRQFSAKGQVGLKKVLDAIILDSQINSIFWAAYMLATVKHECANTWEPIEEYGKGGGKSYGVEIAVTDPATKTTYKNKYYGRGYVQLTWEANYKTMDSALSLSGDDSLHLHPEKALDHDTAYKIMSYGMRNGSFTGRNLTSYLNGSTPDYRSARKIINGLDKADSIAGYAERIEFLLRFCNR